MASKGDRAEQRVTQVGTNQRLREVLQKLSDAADSEVEASLYLELGEVLDARYRKLVDNVTTIMGKIENDLRDLMEGLQIEIAGARSIEANHRIEILRVLEADRDRVNSKLHNISNFLMSIETKIHDQAELLSGLIDEDRLDNDGSNDQGSQSKTA